MLPIEQACYWLAHRAPRDARPLDGAAETEIAVVGAGLTGLWTALFLKELEPALDVAVVEQGLAAHGASGRNAGMLSETVDHSHGLAIEHFGEAEARRLARLGETNVAELVAFLEQGQIRCDYEPSGRLMVALTPRQLEEARRTVEIAGSLGLDSFRFFDQEAVRAELDSPLYLGGVWVTGGGILDPVKLVDGLREAAERQGVRIHERSRVTALERRGTGARIQTEGGSLDARRVVLATSAYTHHLLPGITRRFIPLYDYVLVSQPLSAAQRAAIGWRRRQGVTDGRAFFNYYRLTADDRILWGTSEATYYGKPGGPLLRSLPGALRGLAAGLPAALPGTRPARVSLCLGRCDLLDDAAHPVFRAGAGGTRPLWPGVYRPRPRHDPAGRTNPRPYGARPSERAARAGAGSPEAVSLSTRATPLMVGGQRDAGAPPGGPGRAPEPAASAARSDGDRVFELSAGWFERFR
jgi:glycine/D-amino acid oxidase-like deaminating enzyme